MLPFSASLTSFCMNLGQTPSHSLFTGHTGSKWNSVAQSSILSKKPGLLLSKIAHARYLQYWAYLAIVLYTVHCTATGAATMGSVAEFKSFVMNNKAFGNLFCNSQKSFHTSPGSSDSNSRGYRSFFKLNNGICIYKKS